MLRDGGGERLLALNDWFSGISRPRSLVQGRGWRVVYYRWKRTSSVNCSDSSSDSSSERSSERSNYRPHLDTAPRPWAPRSARAGRAAAPQARGDSASARKIRRPSAPASQRRRRRPRRGEGSPSEGGPMPGERTWWWPVVAGGGAGPRSRACRPWGYLEIGGLAKNCARESLGFSTRRAEDGIRLCARARCVQ